MAHKTTSCVTDSVRAAGVTLLSAGHLQSHGVDGTPPALARLVHRAPRSRRLGLDRHTHSGRDSAGRFYRLHIGTVV